MNVKLTGRTLTPYLTQVRQPVSIWGYFHKKTLCPNFSLAEKSNQSNYNVPKTDQSTEWRQ